MQHKIISKLVAFPFFFFFFKGGIVITIQHSLMKI